jgi:hypothetical protein
MMLCSLFTHAAERAAHTHRTTTTTIKHRRTCSTLLAKHVLPRLLRPRRPRGNPSVGAGSGRQPLTPESATMPAAVLLAALLAASWMAVAPLPLPGLPPAAPLPLPLTAPLPLPSPAAVVEAASRRRRLAARSRPGSLGGRAGVGSCAVLRIATAARWTASSKASS